MLCVCGVRGEAKGDPDRASSHRNVVCSVFVYYRLCSPLRHCVSAMIPVTAVGEPGYYVKTPEAEQRRRALDAVDPATAAVQPGYYVITPQAEQLLRALEWQRGNPAWVFCFAQSLRSVHVDRLVFVRRCLRGLVRAAQALLDVWREFENKHGVLGYPACVFCVGLLDATRGAACALRALSNPACNQLVTSAGQALAGTTSAHGAPAPPPDAPNPSSPDASRPTCATSGTPAPPQVSPIRTPPRSPRPADAPACDHSQRDLACVCVCIYKGARVHARRCMYAQRQRGGPTTRRGRNPDLEDAHDGLWYLRRCSTLHYTCTSSCPQHNSPAHVVGPETPASSPHGATRQRFRDSLDRKSIVRFTIRVLLYRVAVWYRVRASSGILA